MRCAEPATQDPPIPVMWRGPLVVVAVLARHVAQLMGKADSNLVHDDAIVADLVYGYELGIAYGWKQQRYSFTPAELASKQA